MARDAEDSTYTCVTSVKQLTGIADTFTTLSETQVQESSWSWTGSDTLKHRPRKSDRLKHRPREKRQTKAHGQEKATH